MNTTSFCHRGRAAARQEVRESRKHWSIHQLFQRLNGESSSPFCYCYLLSLLSSELISTKDFGFVFSRLARARWRQPGWQFPCFSAEVFETAAEQYLVTIPIQSGPRRRPGKLMPEDNRCPEDHIVPGNQAHCEVCGALIRSGMFETRAAEIKLRWA
jgi:hypothetical protein